MERIKPLVPGGKVGENTWNARLAEALRNRGLSSAQFEPLVRIRSGGRILDRKPDVGISEDGHHFVSGKLGEKKEFEAYRSADEYKTVFEQMEGLGEIFALTYPASKNEQFHLHILPRTGREVELAFALHTLDEVADLIFDIVKGQVEETARFVESAKDEASRLLRNAAFELSEAMKGIRDEDLEAVFGGHDFFKSVLEAGLPKGHKKETLRLGASFLFVNQSLFYILLSKSSEIAGTLHVYPRIDAKHVDSPETLWEQYFSKVREVDYEPIYGINVSSFFKGQKARIASGGIVRALLDMAPKLEAHDVAGQVFQTLIPFDIRKPLGANYTNPKAAAVLANLTIEDPNVKVLDPACGSGTLLVASYLRKRELARGRDDRELHKQFLEEDIIGIDAMAFAGHLAAVNLALQQPLVETNCVQIGTTDSTMLHPGDQVLTTGEALPTEFHQASLGSEFGLSQKKKKRRRVVSLRRGEARSFRVGFQDVVIMNPPFTSRDNMAPGYRDRLARRYSSGRYGRATAGKKISQQVYFLLLADEFLKKGGRLASVIPQITLGGKDYWPVVDFIVSSYSVKYVIVGLGRSAFSEDTSLSECMIVCEKEIPNGSAKFRLVGTMKSPDDWTNDDIRTIVEAAKSGFDVPRIVKVREFSQSCLSSKGEMLPELVLQLIPEYENASKLVVDVFGDSRIPMTSIGELRKRGITYRERIEKARHLHELGASALLACRGEERALKQIDRLIFKSHKDGATVFRDRLGDAEFEFLDVELCPSLRRMSYLPHIDMSDDSDFCVSVPSKTLQSAMNRFYSTKEVARIMKHLKQDKMWEKCVEENASRIMCARRIDFSAPGSNCICCWNKRAMFNVSHFMADGFQTELQEKFFCMWMNSTMGIIQLLSTAASTRGAWVGLQKSSVDKMRIPDIGRLESKDWKEVSNLWTRVSKMDLPSLIDQLEKNEGFRVELDDGLLRLLGIDDENARKNIASELRKGGLAAISALKHSMSGDRQGDFVED